MKDSMEDPLLKLAVGIFSPGDVDWRQFTSIDAWGVMYCQVSNDDWGVMKISGERGWWALGDLEELGDGLVSCKDDKIWMLSTAVCRVNKGQNELSTKELETDFQASRP